METEDNMNIIQVKSGPYQTNTYIIEFESFVLVVDPSDDIVTIKEHFKNKDLYGILLTHGHFDHISSLETLLKEHPKSNLYLHKNAKDKLSNPTLNASNFTRHPFAVDYEESYVLEVDDGSIIELPNKAKIKVLFTPGHTNCSVCYLFDQHAFVGDTIFKDYIGAYHFKTGNRVELRSSCYRLIEQSGNLICYPGHYDIAPVSYIREHNKEYLKLIKDLS